MRYCLIDANNLAVRALHASQGSELSADGVPTGAGLIFINSLARWFAETAPTHVGLAWDGQSAHRRALMPDYKANRPQTLDSDLRDGAFALIWEFLDAAGLPHYRSEALEADDLIASWWQNITDGHITIVSGDKDLLQMAGPNPHGVETQVLRPSSARNETDVWDAARVLDELGCEPRHWPLMTALTGDTSDGVAGIPRIGPKRALKLLRRYDWDLSAALAEHEEYRAQVLTNLRVVDLRDLPITGAPLPPPTTLATYTDGDALSTFFDRYAYAQLAGRYARGELWTAPGPPPGMGRSLRPRQAERSLADTWAQAP